MATSREKFDLVISAKDQSKGALNSVKSNILAVGAAYLTFSGIKTILEGIVTAGIEHEKVWNDVSASLQRHDHEVIKNTESIKEFADEMQTLSGISDEVVGKSVQRFIDYGSTIEEAMSSTQVALDLAAGGAMSLESATDLLSKASVGYTGTLSRYGIILDESIPKSEKYAEAIKQINEKFGGAAQARADTFAVKMSLLGERFGDLQESIFKASTGSGTFADSLTWVSEGVANLGKAIDLAFSSDDVIYITDADQAIRDLGVTANETGTEIQTLGDHIDDMGLFISNVTETVGLFKDTLDLVWDSMKIGLTAVDALSFLLAGDFDKAKDAWTNFGNSLKKDVVDITQSSEKLRRVQLLIFASPSDREIMRATWAMLDSLVKDTVETTEEANTSRVVSNLKLEKLINQSNAKIAEFDKATLQASSDAHNEAINTKIERVEGSYAYELELTDTYLEQKRLLIALGNSEEIASELAKNQFLYDEQVLQNALEYELMANKLAVELGLTRDQLDEMLDAYKQKYDQVERYIGAYARRISGDFRSSIHQMVRDSDSGALSMKALWKNLGKSIRSVLIDMVLDGIFAVIAGIGSKITAMVAEGVAVSALTSHYIALGAAQALYNPLAAGAGIAASNAVLGQGVLIKGLAGFDDPVNDAVAFRHGRDYASQFMAGQSEIYSAPNYGNAMVALQPEQGFAGGGATINININGDNYDTDAMVARIEDSIRNGLSSLALSDDDTITGTQDARFA